MAWYLNKALTTMRDEVNARWPGRDKASDGTIGDEAHQGTSSDHNPDSDGSVDAWDMDIHLYGPSGGKPSSDLEFLKGRFQAHESSKYWIHDRIICSRSTGWVRENYTGSNPHDKHIHWNTRTEYEDSTKPWGIDDMTKEEFIAWFPEAFAAALENGTVQQRLRRETVSYPMSSNPAYNVLSLFSMLRSTVPAIAEQVGMDPDDLAAIEQAAREGAEAGAADVQAIVDGVLAGLNTAGLSDEQIADVEAAVRSVFADAAAQ